jgi:arylsulfatase A-like enzyme
VPCALGCLFALALSIGIARDATARFDRGQAKLPNARGRQLYWVMPRAIAEPLAIQRVPARFTPDVRLESPGRIELGAWRPHERAFVYESESAGGVVLRTFAFPGWVARIDGEPVPIAAAGRWGSIRIEAPSGRHEVRVTFETTPLRRLGAAISAMAAVVLLVAIARERTSPRRAAAAAALLLAALGCGPSERPSARNLVVLTLDTVRRDHLSLYGYERPTSPQLEAFGRDSVVFWNAFAQDTNTNPSHASMFTGQYPHVHGSRANGHVLRPGVATLASILREQSFATGGFVSSAVLWARGSGLDRGFDVYDDDFDGRRRTGVYTVERARAWLASRNEDERALLFVHLYDAHGPYSPPAVHLERFRSVQPHGRLPVLPPHMLAFDAERRPFSALSQYVDRYDATLRHVDDLFGLLLGGIDLASTAVIVLADHGETLGERHHGLDHGGQVFDEQIRIPWIVRTPGIAARRVEAPVETVDLLPTALDLLGVAPPALAADAIQGRSLVPLLVGEAAPDFARPIFSAARAVSARHGDRGYALDPGRRIQTVRSTGWKLIRYPGTRGDYLELYALNADPGERHDVALREPARLAEYRALLDAWSAQDAAGEVHVDSALHERLRELGYVDEPAARP